MAAGLHGFRIDRSGALTCHGDAAAVFPWWSFTKTVIAALALRLAGQGRMSLDAPVPQGPFTLRQLLGHRAGLRDYGALPSYHRAVVAGEAPWPRARLLDEALAEGPLFAPGHGWSYSNIGYMFAVEAIEAAAGMGLAQVVDEWIAGPLDLRSVRIARTIGDMAVTHWDMGGYHPGWVYHRCLTGSGPDAARLLHALMTGGWLTRDQLAQMRQAHVLGGTLPDRPWLRHGYGLGLMSGAVAIGRAEGHSGAGPFCTNAVYHFADRGVTVATFSDAPREGFAEQAAVRLAERGDSPGRTRG